MSCTEYETQAHSDTLTPDTPTLCPSYVSKTNRADTTKNTKITRSYTSLLLAEQSPADPDADGCERQQPNHAPKQLPVEEIRVEVEGDLDVVEDQEEQRGGGDKYTRLQIVLNR